MTNHSTSNDEYTVICGTKPVWENPSHSLKHQQDGGYVILLDRVIVDKVE